MEAEDQTADGMVSVRRFRQHYTKIAERMAHQSTSVSGAGEPVVAKLPVEPPADAPGGESAASQRHLDIGDIRVVSSYDEVEQRIATRMALLASQAAEAKQAVAAAAAVVDQQRTRNRTTSPRSKKFEKLKQTINGMTAAQVASLNPSQKRQYSSILFKIQAKEEAERRLLAEQKQRLLLATRRHKQAKAAAASLPASNLQMESLPPASTSYSAASAIHSGDSGRGSGTTLAPSAAGSQPVLRIDEVILTVCVFFHGRGAASPAQELEVIGSQPLSALVDRISCLYDRPEVFSRYSWYASDSSREYKSILPCREVRTGISAEVGRWAEVHGLTLLPALLWCRQRSFGHTEDAERIAESGLLNNTPGRCKALFIEGVFYEDRRVEGWERGALGRPLVAWARLNKEHREKQQAERDAAEKQQLEESWNGGGNASKRRRLNRTWSDGSSVAAAAAAGAGQTVISRLRADKAAEGKAEGDLSRVTFDELTIRLGEEYLYLHQLDCEHSLVFTRMRIVSPAERQTLSPASFPRETRRHEEKRRLCNACDCKSATVVVLADKLAPSHPAFYCNDCAHALHKAPFRTMDGRQTFNRLYDGYTVRPYFFECGNFSKVVDLDGGLVRTGSGAPALSAARRAGKQHQRVVAAPVSATAHQQEQEQEQEEQEQHKQQQQAPNAIQLPLVLAPEAGAGTDGIGQESRPLGLTNP